MATLNLIFNRPKILLSTYDVWTDDYEAVILFSTRRIERAWNVFRRNHHQKPKTRMRRVLIVMVNVVRAWQSLVSRAQLAIGQGHPVDFAELPADLRDGGENPNAAQVAALDKVIMELNDTMREILVHARTRVIDDDLIEG